MIASYDRVLLFFLFKNFNLLHLTNDNQHADDNTLIFSFFFFSSENKLSLLSDYSSQLILD